MGVALVPNSVRRRITTKNEILRGILAEMAGIFVLVVSIFFSLVKINKNVARIVVIVSYKQKHALFRFEGTGLYW